MLVPLAPAAQNLGVGLKRLLKLDLYYPFVCGATRAGQRAARREVQKHKPTPANDPRNGPLLVGFFNFRVDKGLGEMAIRCHYQSPVSQIAKFYFQRSSGFAYPLVVRRLFK